MKTKLLLTLIFLVALLIAVAGWTVQAARWAATGSRDATPQPQSA
jgi:hypothetical protein